MIRNRYLPLLGVLVLFTACGHTVTYTRRVAIERPDITNADQTTWLFEVWNEEERGHHHTQIRQRTTVVVCRSDRTPPCVRVAPIETQDLEFLRAWVQSEYDITSDSEDPE